MKQKISIFKWQKFHSEDVHICTIFLNKQNKIYMYKLRRCGSTVCFHQHDTVNKSSIVLSTTAFFFLSTLNEFTVPWLSAARWSEERSVVRANQILNPY
jgi:hypothetical protein